MTFGTILLILIAISEYVWLAFLTVASSGQKAHIEELEHVVYHRIFNGKPKAINPFRIFDDPTFEASVKSHKMQLKALRDHLGLEIEVTPAAPEKFSFVKKSK